MVDEKIGKVAEGEKQKRKRERKEKKRKEKKRCSFMFLRFYVERA
jgi:hypothetical protein